MRRNFIFVAVFISQHLHQGRHQLKIPLDSTISLFSFHSCLITLQGLVWELQNKELSCFSSLGIKNVNNQEVIIFDVQQGALLLVVEVGYFW
jgi:thiamine pyrophosphokinase